MDKLRIVNHLTMMAEFGISVSGTTKRFCRKQLERDVEYISGTGASDSGAKNGSKKEFAYTVDIDRILSDAADALKGEHRPKESRPRGRVM